MPLTSMSNVYQNKPTEFNDILSILDKNAQQLANLPRHKAANSRFGGNKSSANVLKKPLCHNGLLISKDYNLE